MFWSFTFADNNVESLITPIARDLIIDNSIAISRNLTIQFSSEIDDELLGMLCDTQWGVPGQLVFRQMKIREFVSHAAYITWISLKRGNRTLLVLAANYHNLAIDNRNVNSYQLRYLTAFTPAARRSKGRSKSGISRNKKRSILRDVVNDALAKQNLFPYSNRQHQGEIYYAFIEDNNTYSRNLTETIGMGTMRTISSMAFCRLKPGKANEFSRANTSDYPMLSELLKEQYESYSFFRLNDIFRFGEYFVLRTESNIAAGVQVYKNHLIIDNISGLKGYVIKNVLARIPGVARYFNLKGFQYVMFGGIVARPGKEHLLPTLFESALAECNMNVGMFWGDPECDVYQCIKKSGNRGIMSLFLPSASVTCAARFEGFEQQSIVEYGKKRLFVNLIDLA